MTQRTITPAREAIREGRASLGIELGSTRIKACLVDADGRMLASGHHAWDNELADGLWTYRLDDARAGLRSAYAALAAEVEREHGERLERLAAVGVSAMMHGYLAFDADGELLVPFRTWRNVNTTRAAAALSDALDVNIPLRWSIAHLNQAVLDGEEHVGRIAHITTLAGHVHELLTGERVLGIGDASGMFPVDPATGDYDAERMRTADALLADAGAPHLRLGSVLPPVRRAGEPAGALTAEGAALLDATGVLRPGAVAAPPEGDAGTGMVATNAVAPRTGNVSVGTSIFAMVVLERPLAGRHADIDLVATPSGEAVAMVHCNNGVSELGEWAGVFHEFAGRVGSSATRDEVFGALLGGALDAGADDGILAYNHLSGEPIAGLDEGRPMIVRTPESRLTLAGLMRAQVRGAFATLSMGMRTLAGEGVRIDEISAHGGMFRTKGAAQRLLAAALGAPVAVSDTAGEGGAWGMALLARYAAEARRGEVPPLSEWLAARVFGEIDAVRVEPTEADRTDHEAFLSRWEAGLSAERAAAEAIR